MSIRSRSTARNLFFRLLAAAVVPSTFPGGAAYLNELCRIDERIADSPSSMHSTRLDAGCVTPFDKFRAGLSGLQAALT